MSDVSGSNPESHLYTIPQTVDQLLMPHVTELPEDADPAAIIATAEYNVRDVDVVNSSVQVALEALAQAGLVIGKAASESATGELGYNAATDHSSSAVGEDRTKFLTGARVRRGKAIHVLSQAARHFKENYYSQGGDGVEDDDEMDSAAVMELMVRTESKDEHPALAILQQAMLESRRKGTLEQAQVRIIAASNIIRVLFDDNVNIEVTEEVTPEGPNSDPKAPRAA